MSLNGSGVFVVNSAGQPVVASTLITSAAFNAYTADVATALSTAIYKDGQQTVTANTPWGGFRITNVGITGIAGTVGTPAINLSDSATGWYRIGSNNIGLSINGTKLADYSSALVAITGALTTTTTVTVGTALTVSGAGPHAIGGVTSVNYQLLLNGTFTGNTSTFGLGINSTYPAVAGNDAYASYITPTINKAGSGTHPNFASLVVSPPTIAAGAASLTNAFTLWVTGQPTVGDNLRAIKVTGLTEMASSTEALRLTTSGDVTGAGTIYMRFNDTNGNAAYLGYGGSAASQFDVYNVKNGPVAIFTNNLQRLLISAAGSIVPATAALATTATDGFIYMTSSAGAPTGVPTTFTGRLAFHYDSTNNQIYVYNGAWKKTAALT